MTQSSTSYIFVGCDGRFGCITLSGPNGEKYVVSPSGKWIPDIFDRDERYINIEVERWCFKTRKFIKQKPVFLLEPNERQMALKPGGN